MGSRSEQETKQVPSMEASKFFGRHMPPAFKFDPTDADIVAHYLLPRALNLDNPHAHAIVDGDPTSAPPWEILKSCGGVAHAFFFGPPTDPSQNGGRRNRTVNGGVWQGQKAVEGTVTLLRPGGGEVNIRYKRYDLSFCLAKRGPTTGYVMHEYEILWPPLPGTVLTRIKAPKSVKKQQQVQDPEQPGPSHQYAASAMIGNGQGFAGAQHGALYGGGMLQNAGYYSTPLQFDLPLVGYDNNCYVPIQDQPGASYNYDAVATNGGEGFTGAQVQGFYGGGMVDASGAYYDPSGYVPECGGDYSNYYGDYEQWRYQQDQSNQYQAGDAALMSAGVEQQAGAPCGNSDNGSVMGTEASAHSTISLGEFQQWQNQQDPSNQYQAGDDAVICADGEGFSGEEQAGALCGNSDNDSVLGTESSAHSTISLCGDGDGDGDGDGEIQLDDDSFFKLFFGNDDDLDCEQNGASDTAHEL